jgi:hypothetical protein
MRAAADGARQAPGRHRYEHTVGAGASFRDYTRNCDVDVSTVSRTPRLRDADLSSTHAVNKRCRRARPDQRSAARRDRGRRLLRLADVANCTSPTAVPYG